MRLLHFLVSTRCQLFGEEMVMMSFLFGSKHPGVSALAVMEHAAPFQPIWVMLRPSGVSSEYWFVKLERT